MRFVVALCLLLACTCTQAQALRVETLEPAAAGLSDRPLRVRVYLPPDYDATQARYDVLYVNDGQDMEAVGLQAALERLDRVHAIRRIIVVAIDMPQDRMAGYGLFDRARGEAIVAETKYGAVGANAQMYAAWLVQVLVPMVDARYRTLASADGRAILGWSLGAVSAFGIGWQYPELFGRIGAFSPSFWLSSDAQAVQATRIVHALVAAGAPASKPSLFFAVGTKEETNDRDGDGVIDVLDDARDLIDLLRPYGYDTHLDGERMPASTDATLYLLEGGQHNQASWARMLPAFLRWAYAAQTGSPVNQPSR